MHNYDAELDNHDVLIADGMLCESYSNDGHYAPILAAEGKLYLGRSPL